jgi:protein phosphatase
MFSVFDYSANNCIKIIEKATLIHLDQKAQSFHPNIGNIFKDYIYFNVPENLVVIGDIHGDFFTLKKIMEKIDFISYLKNPSNLIIFLGDYIDRGKYSIEVLLFLCKLKSEFPNNVFMLRGNHEAYRYFPFSSYDLYHKLLDRFGNSVDIIYNSYILPFFESLFLTCEISNFSFLAHGGFPIIEDDNFFKNYKIYLSDVVNNKALLEEILWNDPRNLPSEKSWVHSNRGLGKYFGSIITKLWLSNTGCKFLFRGHEPCDGYKLIHDNKVLTIFSSKEPYPKFNSSFLKLSKQDIADINNDGSLLVKFIYFV